MRLISMTCANAGFSATRPWSDVKRVYRTEHEDGTFITFKGSNVTIQCGIPYAHLVRAWSLSTDSTSPAVVDNLGECCVCNGSIEDWPKPYVTVENGQPTKGKMNDS